MPGTHDPVKNADEVVAFAKEYGVPVAIKAAFGGGGRGMKVARTIEEIPELFESATREAVAAFGRGECFVERYLDKPRHVEAQVIADMHGNAVHLWERDCSMQRRHQKLVEESPSPVLRQEVREKLCDAAVRLVKAAGYTNAGTVEFLVDKAQNFYILEVNARIQVEHPVTEQVTGIDLIKEQIRVAAGERLSFAQKDVKQVGHAIECRINAEDPDRNFAPSAGLIEQWRAPGGPGVRLDTHAHAGYRIPPNYDSMIGKLIVHRPTRAEAIATMKRALAEFHVGPTKTTIPLHLRIMDDEHFRAGDVDTGFVERVLLQK